MDKLARWEKGRVIDGKWIIHQLAEEESNGAKKYSEKLIKRYKRYLKDNFHIDFEFFKDKNVLEVGCGGFGLVHYIDVRCLRVGVDPIRSAGALSKRHIMHVTSIREYLPFKREVFDVAICINVLDHVLNPNFLLKEIRRVLKMDGLFILDVNTYSFMLKSKFWRLMLALFDKPHLFHISPNELISSLEQARFIVKYQYAKKLDVKWAITKSRIKVVDILKSLIATIFGIQVSFCLCSKSSVDWRSRHLVESD